MKQRQQEKPFEALSVEQVRAELDSVLKSTHFSQAPKLCRLLEYMCQKSILLEGDKLTEYTIALDVLGKPETFKESRDSSVRVEVYRLRKKLAQFYEGAGQDHSVRIILPQGQYCPEFKYIESASGADLSLDLQPVPEAASSLSFPVFQPEVVEPAIDLNTAGPAETEPDPPEPRSPRPNRFRVSTIAASILGCVAALILAALIAFFIGNGRHGETNMPAVQTAKPGTGVHTEATPAVPEEIVSGLPSVRILAGYSGPAYRDMAGAEWTPDQFFSGGRAMHADIPHIGRTYDQLRYANSRIGECAYDIPVPPGTYEIHLYFMEHEFAPEVGRGENDRTFFLHLNDRRILPAIDVESDVMGPNVADERVFKSIRPGANGKIHIALESATGIPLINAIEIVPGLPHSQLPIRLVPQRAPVTDHLGRVWRPDQYSFNGQITPRNQVIANTSDPQLYSVERYGHFDYSIPVDVDGQYTVNLHFAEAYFGPHLAGEGGVGSRVFNVMADGIMIFPKLDIFAEAGAGKALIKSAHHIKPTAQGKLNLTFEPVMNYALIDAIEVLDESQ